MFIYFILARSQVKKDSTRYVSYANANAHFILFSSQYDSVNAIEDFENTSEILKARTIRFLSDGLIFVLQLFFF